MDIKKLESLVYQQQAEIRQLKAEVRSLSGSLDHLARKTGEFVDGAGALMTEQEKQKVAGQNFYRNHAIALARTPVDKRFLG